MSRQDGKCYGGPWDGKQLVSENKTVQLAAMPPIAMLTPPQAHGDPQFTVHAFAGQYAWHGDPDPKDERGPYWHWQGGPS